MPAATPLYAIPYQQENDPPSGDELGRDLAAKVEELIEQLADLLKQAEHDIGTKVSSATYSAAIAALTTRANSNAAAIATKAALTDIHWTNNNATNLTNVVNRRSFPRGVTFTGIALTAGQAKVFTRPIPAGDTMAVYCTGVTNWGVSLVQAHGIGGVMTCVFRNNGTRNLSGVNATVNYLIY